MDSLLIDYSLAEPSVIGAMVMFPEETGFVFQKLSAECFSDSVLGSLFSAIQKIKSSGKTVDPVTLENEVGNEHRLLIVRCAEVVPSLHGFTEYVEIVKEQWRKRTVLLELQSILQEKRISVSEILQSLEKTIAVQNKIEESISEDSAKNFSDSFVEFYCDLGTKSNAIKTGWSGFDNLTGGLERQGVYIISARPGKGKTDLAINLAMNISKHFRVNYNTMEMPRKQVMRRITARATKINSSRLRDKECLTDTDFLAINKAYEFLSKNTQLILDEQQRIEPIEVESKILRYKPDVLFIDHLGLMKKEQRRNEWEAVAETTQFLKELAMKYNIVIVELVQQHRAADTRSGPPKMSELRGGGSLEADTDGIFFIESPDCENTLSGDDSLESSVYVAKNRHGGTGLVKFNWFPQYHTWIQIDHKRESDEQHGKPY